MARTPMVLPVATLSITQGSTFSNQIGGTDIDQLRSVTIAGPDAVDANVVYKVQVADSWANPNIKWKFLSDGHGNHYVIGKSEAVPLVGGAFFGIRLIAVDATDGVTEVAVAAQRDFVLIGYNPWTPQ